MLPCAQRLLAALQMNQLYAFRPPPAPRAHSNWFQKFVTASTTIAMVPSTKVLAGNPRQLAKPAIYEATAKTAAHGSKTTLSPIARVIARTVARKATFAQETSVFQRQVDCLPSRQKYVMDMITI